MCHDVSPQALTRPRDRVNLRSAAARPASCRSPGASQAMTPWRTTRCRRAGSSCCKSSGSNQGGPPACAWVAAIVRHETTHRLVAERRELPLDGLEGAASPWSGTGQSADATSPEAETYSRELTHVLLEVIDELPPAFRDVVRLRDLEDRPADEVARRLHISRQNVAVRLHRAHRLLRAVVKRRLAEVPHGNSRRPKKDRESL